MTLSKFTIQPRARRFRSRAVWATGLSTLFLAGMLLTLVGGATAAVSAVNLGTATSFAVLAGTPNITDVPTSVITGDVGLNPAGGSAIGLSCAEVTGTIYSVDSSGPACQVTNPSLLGTAKTDLTAAYVSAAGETPSTTLAGADNQLGGQNLAPGVYNFGDATTANLTGNLTLTGNSSDVWVFQASDQLVTASSSTVTFAGGAQACNVFWQVSSSATLGTNSTFAGTIMALTNIVVPTNVTIDGRVLARNGSVTLDDDTISRSDCATPPSSTTDSTTTDTTPAPTTTTAAATTTATVVATTTTTPTAARITTTTPRVTTTSARTTTTTAAAKASLRAETRRAAAASATAARVTAAKAATAKRAAQKRAAGAVAAKKAAARRAAIARGHAEPALGNAGLTG
jgi:hypothetical protein